MNFSLKHTINVTSEVFSPIDASGFCGRGYSARRLHVARIGQDMDLTLEQLTTLSSIVLIKEGVGDFWTAIREDRLGDQFNSENWMAVEEVLSTMVKQLVETVSLDRHLEGPKSSAY
jgi:hypothetical protein